MKRARDYSNNERFSTAIESMVIDLTGDSGKEEEGRKSKVRAII
jgi:hypothetical protein